MDSERDRDEQEHAERQRTAMMSPSTRRTVTLQADPVRYWTMTKNSAPERNATQPNRKPTR